MAMSDSVPPVRVTTFHLPDAALEALQQEARADGVTQAEIIRQALEIRRAVKAIAAAAEAGAPVGDLVAQLLAKPPSRE
jgi:hypothetical protein